jgi:hypothetical protein
MVRLGYNGVDEIKVHPFFREIDWPLLEEKKFDPPEVLERAGKKSLYFNQSDPTESGESHLNTRDKCHFANFTYEGEG